MTKVSKSPERNTFQREKYIERCQKDNKEVSQDYLDMFDEVIKQDNDKFSDPKSRINNMEYDLRTADWMLEKVRNDEAYAQNLYAAICNNDFVKNDVWPILQDKRWSCTWRYAGGIIADMRQQGDYIDWYCSGIKNPPPDEKEIQKLTHEELERLKIYQRFVGEGFVSDQIRKDLSKLGWIVIDDDSQPI